MDKPDHWWDVPEKEREQRIEPTSDTCIIDNEEFFIRGVIEIHVQDYPEVFGFGVWFRRSGKTSTSIWRTSTQPTSDHSSAGCVTGSTITLRIRGC
jgi:hypothetical protein